MAKLPEEYLGSICEVKTLDNDIFATGIISVITPEYVEISDRSGFMSMARLGTQLKVNVYNARLGFRVLRGSVYISNDKFFRLVDIVNLLDHERRNFFRVDTNIHAHILPYTGKEEADGENVERVRVQVKNLSLGGALILSDVEFREGESLTLELNLSRRFCQFHGKVCRILEAEPPAYLYGCEFFDTSDLNTDALCAFVFQRQREQIHRKEDPTV